MTSQTRELDENQRLLLKVAKATMPFGRYKDRPLVDLPEPYLCWFAREGFPDGELGQMLALMHELKINGLEYLIRPLVKGPIPRLIRRQ